MGPTEDRDPRVGFSRRPAHRQGALTGKERELGIEHRARRGFEAQHPTLLSFGYIQVPVSIKREALGLAQPTSEQRETIEGAILFERGLEDDPLAGLMIVRGPRVLSVILVILVRFSLLTNLFGREEQRAEAVQLKVLWPREATFDDRTDKAVGQTDLEDRPSELFLVALPSLRSGKQVAGRIERQPSEFLEPIR